MRSHRFSNAAVRGGTLKSSQPLSFLPINNLTIPNITPGYIPALNWERTQPWTSIAIINVAAAPTGGGAAIIFTTCNQGSVDTAYPGYELWIDSSGHLRVRILNNITGNNYIDVNGSTNVCDGTTRTVAASYDGSSTAAGVKLYVNGTLETPTVNKDTLSATIVTTQPIYIGNQKGWPYSLGGTMSEFSLSNVVRSGATIAAYTTARAAKDANTVLAYNFSENTGKITADLSGNGYNGWVANATWQSSVVGKAPCVIQSNFDSDNQASRTSTSTLTASIAAISGSTIILTAIVAASSGTIAFSDNQSNTYTITQTNTNLAGVKVAQAIATNVTNGPTIFTASLGGPSGTFWRIAETELQNVVTSTPVDTFANLYSSSIGTGTDAVTSGSLSTALNFDLIYGVGAFMPGTISVGTGYTGMETVVNDALTLEYKVFPETGPTAATFTQSSTSQCTVLALALKSP